MSRAFYSRQADEIHLYRALVHMVCVNKLLAQRVEKVACALCANIIGKHRLG